mmetsp:Transcript_7084/g.10579  ORF Transcript_7084/g.10579 Transcript_7084/m.10579 type:complete len:112 (-) Transcript_7084:226-561(-)
MPVAAVVAKSAVTERTYVPQEQEIVDEIMKTRQTAPDIGIKSLYRKIRDQKTDWKINAKTFRKIAIQCYCKAHLAEEDKIRCPEIFDDDYVVVDHNDMARDTDDCEYIVVG